MTEADHRQRRQKMWHWETKKVSETWGNNDNGMVQLIQRQRKNYGYIGSDACKMEVATRIQ